jgi:hypothetical protein
MKKQEEDRVKQILKQSLPPVDPTAEPSRDLWPAVLRLIDSDPAAAPDPARQNWFDWALLAGLVVFGVSFPATIPVLLYYL